MSAKNGDCRKCLDVGVHNCLNCVTLFGGGETDAAVNAAEAEAGSRKAGSPAESKGVWRGEEAFPVRTVNEIT